VATFKMIDMPADLTLRGTFYPAGFVPPANCIGNTAWLTSSPLAATNQEHQFQVNYSQVHGTAAVTERKPIYIARAAGSVVAVRAGSVVACVGAATIVVDVKRNGTTILSATITLDNANTAYVPESGSVSVTSYSADDVFEVVVTATAGGGTLGQGLFVNMVVREGA
jgi:hypothetical protein